MDHMARVVLTKADWLANVALNAHTTNYYVRLIVLMLSRTLNYPRMMMMRKVANLKRRGLKRKLKSLPPTLLWLRFHMRTLTVLNMPRKPQTCASLLTDYFCLFTPCWPSPMSHLTRLSGPSADNT